MSTPVVVIGAGRPNKLIALVAEFAIRSFCEDVKVIHTYDTPFIPTADAHNTNNVLHRDRWEEPCEWIPTGHPCGTMFSFCRHMVPEICNHEGEAIYIDCDMIVFDSIQKIWDISLGDTWVAGVAKCHQLSVLKIDCTAFRNHTIRELLVRKKWTYSQLQRCEYLPAGRLKRKIPSEWNHLDRFLPGKTKLLHYTRMPTQPWVKPGHPVGSLWFNYLAQAVQTGVIDIGLVEDEIQKQNIKRVWQAAIWPQPHVLEELKGRL